MQTGGTVSFSVVTVCLNCIDSLRETLESVLAQGYPEVEIIVIDGGSTDGTREYLEANEERIDVVVSEPDRGIYDAMNKGAARATGDYILFLNAGDRFKDSSVLDSVARDPAVASKEATIVSGRVQYSVDGGLLELYRPRKLAYEHEMPAHQGAFIARKLQQGNAYDANLRYVGDYEFWCRLKKLGLFEVRYIDDVVSIFEYGGASTDSRNDYRRFLERARVDDRYGKPFGLRRWAALGARAVLRRLMLKVLGPRRYLQATAPAKHR